VDAQGYPGAGSHPPARVGPRTCGATVKTANGGEEVGYDGGKKIKGRKRHLLVDTMGLVLAVVIHTAGIQDRAGAVRILTPELSEQFPRLEVTFADQGYTGELQRQIDETCDYRLQVVHRNGDNPRGQWVDPEQPEPTKPSGFQVVPKRWIVERTFGWWNYWRRTAKEYERLTSSSVGGILWLSSARMLAQLAAG
jgi:putative transposase